MEPNIHTLEKGFEYILEGLGLDWAQDAHMQDTPRRAAKAWYNEICSGITKDPPVITTFPSENENIVLLRDIPVMSICSHHLLPFIGKACVSYIPGGRKLLGLSKLSRIVNYRARRPQVQENLTEEIAEDIFDLLDGGVETGVGVIISARHMCMELRGVRHASDMVTSSLLGRYREGNLRSEFLSLARE